MDPKRTMPSSSRNIPVMSDTITMAVMYCVRDIINYKSKMVCKVKLSSFSEKVIDKSRNMGIARKARLFLTSARPLPAASTGKMAPTPFATRMETNA